jgi:hypothetical protein
MIDALRLAAGWLLAWLLGVGIVAALAPCRKGVGAAVPARRADTRTATWRGDAVWTIGSGFFAGAFVLTVWMRILSAAHVRFSVASIAAPLAIATLALLALAYARRRSRNLAVVTGTGNDVVAANAAPRGPDTPLSNPLRALWWALAAWLAARFVMLLLEVVRIPLYPWDAWEQWATKARVWYAFGRIVPFVDVGAWFAAHGTAWTDASPAYPATIPLWQVWSSIALGRWDDALMNLPWWLTGVALALAVYGAVRRSGASALAAMVGAWLVSSLPLANVHVALAGYADLPMAGYYALAALALWRWAEARRMGDALLALVLAVACPSIKTPGIVWALTLAPAVLVTLLPKRGLRLVGIGLAIAAFVLLVLARAHPQVLGYRLHLDFAPAWEGLADSFFLLGNWNLLWYAVLACAIVMWRELSRRPLLPLSLVFGTGIAFLAVVFAFTNARNWVSDQTTINRAVLHIAPLAAVWSVLLCVRWLDRHGLAHAKAA